jgi:hypothetical protein
MCDGLIPPLVCVRLVVPLIVDGLGQRLHVIGFLLLRSLVKTVSVLHILLREVTVDSDGWVNEIAGLGESIVCCILS